MKIAIQGELGSFSHLAALRSIPNASIAPCVLSRDALARLNSHDVDAVVLPIENALAGSIVEHYDLLREHDVHIEGETLIRIEHHVIGIRDSDLASVQRIYSHPVALAQCRLFFESHPRIEPIGFYDTAGAVKQIVELRDRHAAAIAGIQAADIYGGMVLERSVEDDPANFTRFVLVRAGAPVGWPEGQHKLSLSFEVQHRPGSLAAVLQAIAALDGNVTKIQSRPVRGQPWRYHFFVDVMMADAATTDRLLEALPEACASFKVMGRYPAAREFEQISETSSATS